MIYYTYSGRRPRLPTVTPTKPGPPNEKKKAHKLQKEVLSRIRISPGETGAHKAERASDQLEFKAHLHKKWAASFALQGAQRKKQLLVVYNCTTQIETLM